MAKRTEETSPEDGGQGQMAGSEVEAERARDVEAGSGSAAMDTAIVNFAEDLGRLLGTAQAKATSWLEQRKAITDQLTAIRDAANQYLQQLSGAGGSAAGAGGAAGRGRPAGSRKKKGSPAPPSVTRKTKKSSARKGRKLSEETKAKMRAAQQARWAKARGAQST